MVFPKIWLRNQSLDSVANTCPSPCPLPTYSRSEDQGAPAIVSPYLRSVDRRHTHADNLASTDCK